MKQNNRLEIFLGAIIGILVSILLMGSIKQGFNINGSLNYPTMLLMTLILMSVYLSIFPKFKKFWLYLLIVCVGGYLLSLPFPEELTISFKAVLFTIVLLIFLVIMLRCYNLKKIK
ncbi:MAG: hypothetical protein WAZ61_00170 [Lactococcus chungangensis]|jgi:hypothetical protein|uniref:hypothetical protein n=1 Tax=Pseudolactococcus chungangensis TaxID=451457 RepID=UPI00169330E1|nr:hypothetical protein [Lactococcus chungangensis]NMC58257.1 hypothetical protein [Candidatus Methanofastidiosa archaeon]